ncbi:universal stress protein [Natrinema hispanicum]|uniref:Nucleotide-binding universal stress protein, UspA family n=1 Tax=Natrinema hispanicum TaxID=392421 RepID=A0A1I0II06_9EURY|nr:universal stress protein [Natrinema hispanicum]SDD39023.1 Nucleotide-binding universal stress protein, UspA family [Natrinema hispanicum]SET96641.1 Nucleotide-binding universal stress protein, UspA family [Natrinema hispanicum]
MYQELLLATDGSDVARQATEHGIDLADQLDATLHVLSVSEAGPQAENKQDRLRTDPDEEATTAADEAKEAATRAGIDATTDIRHGVPQEQIVDYAETNPVDMVIVGTAGRSGLEHLLSGSVAEEIVRNAPVPVLTVRDQT